MNRLWCKWNDSRDVDPLAQRKTGKLVFLSLHGEVCLGIQTHSNWVLDTFDVATFCFPYVRHLLRVEQWHAHAVASLDELYYFLHSSCFTETASQAPFV